MKKILLVDDDNYFRDVLSDILSYIAPKEFYFQKARNGKEGLEILLQEAPFYGLVTDFNMPIMTGGELIREIISREIQLHKIILLSGLIENGNEIKELNKTTYDITFHTKPIAPNKLIRLLRN